MSRSGIHRRALALFRDLARNDPYRPEPYVSGLRSAQAINDIDGIQWACVGMLNQQWAREQRDVADTARRVAEATLKELRDQHLTAEADRFEAACKAACQRDCMVIASYTGDADIDLVVVEPSGSICSIHNPRTIGGGVISGDTTTQSGKATAAGTYEAYVCPFAFSGEYKVYVKKVWGKVAAGHVTIDVITHFGTDKQTHLHKNIPIGEKPALVMFEVKDGRRTEPLEEQQLGQVATRQMHVSHAVLAQALGASTNSASSKNGDSFGEWAATSWNRNANANAGRFNVNRRGPLGFSPQITRLPTGNSLSGQAIVSADRRYVRFSLFGNSPISSDIIDVTTFNFVTGQGGQQGAGFGAGGGQGGGGFGGGGGGVF
jgi:hypothetical protein